MPHSYVGRTSITMYPEAFTPSNSDQPALDAFLTFVHVREEEPAPHGLQVDQPGDREALELWREAEQLRHQNA